MKVRHWAVTYLVLVAATLSIGATSPALVSADAVSYYWTWQPSANYSAYLNVPQDESGDAPDSQIADAVSEDLYYAAGGSSWSYITANFTNDTWSSPYPTLPYVVDTPIPDNATIISITLTAKFMTASPAGYLIYSLDGGSTYNPFSPELIDAGYGPMYCNITSMETWTPGMINTTDFWVRGLFSCEAGAHYYLEYLGYICYYSVPDATGYIPGEDDPPEDEEDSVDWGDYDVVYTAEGIIMVFGLVGMVGMMAMPAIGVYVYRRGDGDAISVFVKVLAAFMIFLTFFMVYITSLTS